MEAGEAEWLVGRVLVWHAKDPRFSLPYHKQTKQKTRATLIWPLPSAFVSNYLYSIAVGTGWESPEPDLARAVAILR